MKHKTISRIVFLAGFLLLFFAFFANLYAAGDISAGFWNAGAIPLGLLSLFAVALLIIGMRTKDVQTTQKRCISSIILGVAGMSYFIVGAFNEWGGVIWIIWFVSFALLLICSILFCLKNCITE